MANFKIKLSVIILAFVMLVSSSGIIQVSHICKMTLEKHKITGCKDKSTEKHSCCKVPSQKPVPGSDCCNTVLKFYVNKSVTILNDKSDFLICAVPENLVFCNNLNDLVLYSEAFKIADPEYPPDPVGKQKIISLSCFLI